MTDDTGSPNDAIVSLDDLKEFRSIASEDESRAQTAIDGAIALWEEETGRPILSHGMSEVLSGDGSSILLTSDWPIRDVSRLLIVDQEWQVMMPDFTPLTGTLVLDQYQAYVPQHRLWIVARGGNYGGFAQGFGLDVTPHGSSFPEGVANIYVEYMAGYAECPPQVRQALVLITHLGMNDVKLLGMGMKTMGGNTESIQQIKRNWSEYPFIDEVLNHEKRRGT